MRNYVSKIIAIVLVLSMCICTTIFASSVKQLIEVYNDYATIYVNGQKVDANSFLYDNTTYVPLRAVSEMLGMDVEWNQDTKKINITDKKFTKNPSKEYEGFKISDPNSIFKGYFQNVDYSDPNVFLKSYEQTTLSDEIKAIASQFNNNKDLSTVSEIYKWINENIENIDGEKFGRTSDDVIKTRGATGCTDYGLAFIALTRAKGIPSVFVQAAKISWVNNYQTDSRGGTVEGHIFVEVYIDVDKDGDKEWCIVDSTTGRVYLNYDKDNFSLNNAYYVFAKSIEVWDSGVNSELGNYNKMLELFKDFNTKYYQNPKYKYINLINDKIYEAENYSIANKDDAEAVILGEIQSVQKFSAHVDDKYKISLAGIPYIKQETVENCELLVILFAGKYIMPKYLTDLVPELNNDVDNMMLSVTRDGKRIIVIKEKSLEELYKSIENVPKDIFDKDYK